MNVIISNNESHLRGALASSNTSWSRRHLGCAWPQTCSVLITRPYHWPGTQLNLTAGSATDLRGYEPNEPAH